jgi:hypothetical protein
MSTFPISADGPFPPWAGPIFEEDEGLRIALTSVAPSIITNSGKRQKVRFYWENPAREMDPQDRPDTQGDAQSVGEIVYPNIKAGFLSLARDPSREQRTWLQYTQYQPNSANYLGTADDPVYATIDMPIPTYLYYQVSVNGRNIQHVRQITAALLYTVFLERFGVLMCPSGTVRRLDILSGPQEATQLDHEQKRIIRHIWRIRVSSEIEYGSIAGTPVESVLLSVTNTESGTTETSLGTAP